jgi:hypothetical protein
MPIAHTVLSLLIWYHFQPDPCTVPGQYLSRGGLVSFFARIVCWISPVCCHRPAIRWLNLLLIIRQYIAYWRHATTMIQLEHKSTISQELIKRQKLHVLHMICHVKAITIIWPSIAGLSRTEDIMRSYMLLGTLKYISQTINMYRNVWYKSDVSSYFKQSM